jgi:hypothetical protein|tara:strand:- start:100 stop:507 length:408 start_codon:yes stop_codon:yes gene_type:complete
MQKKKLEKAQKKNTENIKAKGLGDTVEKVFKKTGIDKVAKFILGEDCGCDKRKDKLNELFPYNKPECLNEDEFNYLDTYFKSSSNVVTTETQDKLLVIYNRVFHDNKRATSCSSCFKNELHDKLKKVYQEYLTKD